MPYQPSNILAVPVGGMTTASSRHRLYAYLPRLEQAFGPVDILPPHLPRHTFSKYYYALKFIRNSFNHKIIFVQKKIFPRILLKIVTKFARSRIIFDFDDLLGVPKSYVGDITNIHSSSFRYQIMQTELVIVGNGYLRDWAYLNGAKRVVIIPTSVDTNIYKPRRQRTNSIDTIVIGWIGHSVNFSYLGIVEPAILRLQNQLKNITFRVVADKPYIPHLPIEVENVRWSLEHEVDIINGFDVGIMPLIDTPWARGKCAFKAIQCLSCEVPVVASAVGENISLFQENGLADWLAKTEDDWYWLLYKLASSQELAMRVGRKGRNIILDRYSLDVNASMLLESFANILEWAK